MCVAARCCGLVGPVAKVTGKGSTKKSAVADRYINLFAELLTLIGMNLGFEMQSSPSWSQGNQAAEAVEDYVKERVERARRAAAHHDPRRERRRVLDEGDL